MQPSVSAEPVYVDSSTLISLARIERLDLLRVLADAVRVTEVVWREVTGDAAKPGIDALRAARAAGLLQIVNEGDEREFPDLDAGEASCLSAARAAHGAIVVDERKARLLLQRDQALRQTLANVTGVVGLLLLAKQRGVLSEIRPVLDALEAETFRLSAAFRDRILRAVGEL